MNLPILQRSCVQHMASWFVGLRQLLQQQTGEVPRREVDIPNVQEKKTSLPGQVIRREQKSSQRAWSAEVMDSLQCR